MTLWNKIPTKAQISRNAIQRLHISMRHLFIRGGYKPLGVSGETMIESLRALEPEIYGTINDLEKVELNGLLYIFQRLPKGIEQCRYVKLISREGLEQADFEPLIPSKRRRNCYRIDVETMYIEMTRGRSDVYDVLTHLTFMYIEAEKIRNNALDGKQRKNRSWLMIEEIALAIEAGEEYDLERGFTYLSTLLGRTYTETANIYKRFSSSKGVHDLFTIVYGMGRLSIDEETKQIDREISFSSELRNKLGHHFFGEAWAHRIKEAILPAIKARRPVHIISANLHSVMNAIFAKSALGAKAKGKSILDIAQSLSQDDNEDLRVKVHKYAMSHGMKELYDISGTNITVQIIDCKEISTGNLDSELGNLKKAEHICPVIIVMDYAFGEQAYETLDELLKPFESSEGKIPINVQSINIMGKAGILTGDKGDIMIPDAHIFEGSADNYPFENDLKAEDFDDLTVDVFAGPMITVLGTSLQNKDILRYFMQSSWQAVGLEMEGAHYQKAIQSASKIRQSISKDVVLRYAYYASDNPLESGSTLASGSLGLDGVEPTYAITIKMLKRIFEA